MPELTKKFPVQIVVVNGPPRAGKDSFYNAILDKTYDTAAMIAMLQMKDTLLQTAISMFGYSPQEWFSLYEKEKELPQDKLFGMTMREALIWISEDVCKPKFGKDFFGKIFVNKLVKGLTDIENHYEDLKDVIVVVPDLGFKEELEAVIEYFGKDCIHLVQVKRDGHTFEGDSRSYLNGDDFGIPTNVIENNGTLEEYEEKARQLFMSLTGIKGYKQNEDQKESSSEGILEA